MMRVSCKRTRVSKQTATRKLGALTISQGDELRIVRNHANNVFQRVNLACQGLGRQVVGEIDEL